MNECIRVCELFAGIGGFRYGLEKASTQFETVFANELDRYAASIYRRHWPNNTLCEGDIRNIQTQDIPEFDLLCGGFPCQPFSVAGKRQGLRDQRGTLFQEILRIAKTKQPPVLLLENVPGILSIEQGKTFQAILEELGNLGYICEWKVLDSKFFGVPQQRRRVFIIAYLATPRYGGGTFFPIPQGSGSGGKKVGGQNVSTTLTAQYSKCNIGGHTFVTQQVAPTVTSHVGKGGGSDPLIVQPRPRGGKDDQWRVYDGIVPTLTAQMGTGGGNVTMILGDNTGGNIKRRVRSTLDKPSWTLGGSQTLINENQVIRRLTPVECERLQGFPDNWTLYGLTITGARVEISNTQRYKTLGNAVTTNVITAIGKLILLHFEPWIKNITEKEPTLP